MTTLKVLDLFSGLGGWSSSFKKNGHDITTVDIEPKFNPDICDNILNLTHKDLKVWGGYDLILASPPCKCWSVASMDHHYNKTGYDYTPKTQEAKDSEVLLRHLLVLIDELNPTYYWIENPRGLLRKLPEMRARNRTTIHYCQYGHIWKKPTDLWGRWPKEWSIRPQNCKRNNEIISGKNYRWVLDNDNNPCHHSVKRGEHSQGVQQRSGTGFGPAQRAKVPYELSNDVRLAVESAVI